MKTPMELKNEFDQKVEEVSAKIADRIYDYLSEVIDNSLKEFWQDGKITFPEGLDKIYREVFNSENLSVKFDSEICRAIVKNAKKKLEVSLAENGWKITMRVLEPIESASGEEK